jgi:CheY-like chemotaxis protein
MKAGDKRPELVLLIDDDEAVNMLNSIILRKAGVAENIVAVQSGEKGLEVLTEFQTTNRWPGIIFVDINMPGICGWEFIDRFKKDFIQFKQKCIICMLSSSLDPQDRENAKKSDIVDSYLSKPLSIDAANSLGIKYNELTC